MRWFAVTIALLVALFFWASPALGESGEGELSESVPVESPGKLHVELDRGRVAVVAHDEPEVRIEAKARGVGAKSVHFDLRAEGPDLVLTGRSEEWLAFMRAGPTVTVRAWVPREYSVEVHTLVPQARLAPPGSNTGL